MHLTESTSRGSTRRWPWLLRLRACSRLHWPGADSVRTRSCMRRAPHHNTWAGAFCALLALCALTWRMKGFLLYVHREHAGSVWTGWADWLDAHPCAANAVLTGESYVPCRLYDLGTSTCRNFIHSCAVCLFRIWGSRRVSVGDVLQLSNEWNGFPCRFLTLWGTLTCNMFRNSSKGQWVSLDSVNVVEMYEVAGHLGEDSQMNWNEMKYNA